MTYVTSNNFDKKRRVFSWRSELGNGFEKKQIFHNIQYLKLFRLIRQNKVPKEHDGKYISRCGSE